MEGDGAPDLTTQTHSGLSLLASCALWSIPRGHTHTYIYLSTHAGDENILGLYPCLSVFLNVTTYPYVLKSMYATKTFWVFPPVLAPFCPCPSTCLHICVHMYVIYAQQHHIVSKCVPICCSITSASSPCLHMYHVCEPLAVL